MYRSEPSCSCHNLIIHNFIRITFLQKEDGRALLQSFLDWPQFDEEEEPQKAIHLDCVYDCLTFMSQRGLAWTHISKLLVLLQDLLAEFPGKIKLQIYTFATPLKL